MRNAVAKYLMQWGIVGGVIGIVIGLANTDITMVLASIGGAVVAIVLSFVASGGRDLT